MLKFIIAITFSLGTMSLAYSQGKVVFNEEATIASIYKDYVSKNRAETTIKGWRIQLISTDDRREMESNKSRFAALFPGVPSAWKHVSPYYHLRVGAYRSRDELIAKLPEIKKEFPAAIPVQDDIQKYDLINY